MSGNDKGVKLVVSLTSKKERGYMKDFTITLKNIDWELLRKQKQVLINIEGEQVVGVINLLDYIQDEAAKVLSESTVFGEIGGMKPKDFWGKTLAELGFTIDEFNRVADQYELNVCDKCGVIEPSGELWWLEYDNELTDAESIKASNDGEYIALCEKCLNVH